MIMENRTGSGIDVFLHATFLILLGWLGLSHYLVRKSSEDALGGLLFIGSLFFIVVLHELGHALTARRQKGRLMLDPPPNPANPPGPPPDAPAPCGLPAPGTGIAKVLEGRVKPVAAAASIDRDRNGPGRVQALDVFAELLGDFHTARLRPLRNLVSNAPQNHARMIAVAQRQR